MRPASPARSGGPGFAFTAGEYRVRAVTALEDLRHRSRLPILTVGTGSTCVRFWKGWRMPPHARGMRARLEAGADKHSLQYLHRVLRRLDPEAAIRIGSAIALR